MSDFGQPCDIALWVMKRRSSWPIFHGTRFCLISWRLFDIWTPYFRIMSQWDLKINVGHCDLYFMVQWFCLISWKTVWCMKIILQDYESVWPDIWPTNKCRSLWPIFHGPVILPYILKTVWYMKTILSYYESWMFDLKINVGRFDLYFMVQWFWFISWRLFDIWTPYFGIMSQYGPMFDPKIIVGRCDLYFMVQWFCHILKIVCCMNFILQDYESVWPDIWPQNKCRSQ